MEGSTLAKLSRERCAVSSRVAQVRRERSPDAEPGKRAPARRARKAGPDGPAIADIQAPAPGPAGASGSAADPAAYPAAGLHAGAPLAAGPVVAVTGAARGLGQALAARLATSPQVGRVVAIDDHRGDVTGVTWRVVDVRDPALAGRLAAGSRRS
jgi:hypothetical protein